MQTPETGPVIERVTFTLVPGTDDAAFLAAARGTGPAVAALPGFRRRRLMREGADWTDLVEWDSAGHARAAAAAVMADPAFAPFLALIAPGSVAMAHLPVLWQMGD